MDRPPAPASRVQTEKSADQREMELGQQIRKKKKVILAQVTLQLVELSELMY